MEDLVVDVYEKNKLPKISLSRDLDIEDFSNVDERENAVLFILEEDKGWTFVKGNAILKIRLRIADEMKEKLTKYSKDAVIFSVAINLWKVHRFEVKKSEATPDVEDKLKEIVKATILKSIKLINQKADTSF